MDGPKVPGTVDRSTKRKRTGVIHSCRVTQFVYDGLQFVYDGLERKERKRRKRTGIIHSEAAGNLARRTDRNGRVIQFVYDGLERKTDERWYENGSATPSLAISIDTCARPNCGRSLCRIMGVKEEE
jgi:YD repeat-containing protein